MRIGLDFDNTVVSYDALFHKLAREKDLVPPDTPASKVAVRDHLRKINKEEVWTEMQGCAYGARMGEALLYPGVIEFLRRTDRAGHEVAIVSHKTRHPFRGPSYDLHAAARSWIEQNLIADDRTLVPDARVFLELTKEDKLSRIASFQCDVFLDDLPEILQADAFPTRCRRILFDPEGHYAATGLAGCTVVRSWEGFDRCLTL